MCTRGGGSGKLLKSVAFSLPTTACISTRGDGKSAQSAPFSTRQPLHLYQRWATSDKTNFTNNHIHWWVTTFPGGEQQTVPLRLDTLR